jgi:hypothetical protein
MNWHRPKYCLPSRKHASDGATSFWAKIHPTLALRPTRSVVLTTSFDCLTISRTDLMNYLQYTKEGLLRDRASHSASREFLAITRMSLKSNAPVFIAPTTLRSKKVNIKLCPCYYAMKTYSQVKLYCHRRSVGQSVLVSGTHLGPATNFSWINFQTVTDLMMWDAFSDEKSNL